MEIKRIDDDEFAGLSREWNDLLPDCAADNLFLRWEWLHTWWKHFHLDRRLYILTFREDGRLVGIAPFFIASSGLFRSLRLCSEDLAPDYMDVLVRRAREPEVLDALAVYLVKHSADWDEIHFDNLLADSLLLGRLALPAEYPLKTGAGHPCPYLPIHGRYDDFYRTRDRLRSFSLERKHRKLVRERGLEHRVVKDQAGLTNGLEALFDLHDKRARNRALESNFTAPDIRRFHQDVASQFLLSGLLDLELLYSGDSPVAAAYAFTYRKKRYYYQGGFDPEYAKWSVGLIMVNRVVEGAFREGLEEFDFLKGDEGYKSLWSTARRPQFRKTIFNTAWRGVCLSTLARVSSTARLLKAALQSSPRDKPAESFPQ